MFLMMELSTSLRVDMTSLQHFAMRNILSCSALTCCSRMWEVQLMKTFHFCKLKSLYIGEWLITDFYGPLTYFLQRAPSLVTLTLDQCKLYGRHNGNMPSQITMGKEPIVGLKLVSAVIRDLETLWIRLSKGDNIEEFRKMRCLLKEKMNPKETVIVWC